MNQLMEDLRVKSIDEVFEEGGIYTGKYVKFYDLGNNADIFRKIEAETIKERYRRNAAWREADKIYLKIPV